MNAAPVPVAVGVVADLEPLRETLAALGAASGVEAWPEGRVLRCRLANGELRIVEPGSAKSPLGMMLERSGGTWAGVLLEDGETAGEPGLLPEELAGVGIRAGLGAGAPPLAGSDGLALDHVAFAVHDLDAATTELTSLGLAGGDELGRWEFPVLGATSAMRACGSSYVEVNQPWNDDGLFGDALVREGPSLVLVCLRVDDVDAALERLAGAEVRASPVEEVLARRAGTTEEPAAIGRLTALSRRNTAGLRLMLLQTNWPWSREGSA